MMDIQKEARKLREYLVALRRDFHQHPELSMQEHRTARRIEEELDELGIFHTRSAGTGVIGWIRGEGPDTAPQREGEDASQSPVGTAFSSRRGQDRVVALRADIDALPITEPSDREYVSQNPGVMHACGHDLHNTALLGAARILMEHRDLFAGRVKLIFQPGEEIGEGAQEMVAAGEMEGVERIFGLHVAPDLRKGEAGIRTGINNASVDHFKIEIQGKSTHVSTPHLGVDAAYIAAQIVTALQALVTRTTSPVDPVVIGVGVMQAGTSYNIVAGEGMLEGTTRATSQATREDIQRKVTATAQSIAKIYGGRARVIWKDVASALVNDPRAAQEARESAEEIIGRDHVISNRPISLGGDNFAEFLVKVPGVYVYLGTSNEMLPNTLRQIHNEGFDVDEEALEIGAALYASYGLKWLRGDYK